MSKDPASGFAHADERVIKEENGVFSVSAAPGVEGVMEAMLNTHIGTLRNYIGHVLESYDKGERTGVAEVIALSGALSMLVKAVSRLGSGIMTREADVNSTILGQAADVIHEILLQADAIAYSTDDLDTECMLAFKSLRKALRKFPIRFVHSYLFALADEKAAERDRLEEELHRLRQLMQSPDLRGDSRADIDTRIIVAEVRLADAVALVGDAVQLRQEMEAKCNLDEGRDIVLMKDSGIPVSITHRIACLMFEGFGFAADYDVNM